MDERVAAPPAVSSEGQEALTFQSTRFGEITITKERILEFPRGLVGFPSARSFAFLHQEDGVGPFFWLHSLDDPTLAFVVCEPQVFFPDYKVPLSNEEQQILGIKDTSEGVVCLILVVPEDAKNITANLRGPVVVNVGTRQGLQLILAGEDYPTKAFIFPQAQELPEKQEGEAACSS